MFDDTPNTLLRTAVVVEDRTSAPVPYLDVYVPSMGAEASPRVCVPVAGQGAFLGGSWEPGDEVLLAISEGDLNHTYVVGRLHNGKQPQPAADGLLAQHPEGTTIRRTDSAPTEPLAKKIALENLRDGWGSLKSALTAPVLTNPAGVTAPTLAAAITAWQTAIGLAMAQFETQLAALDTLVTSSVEAE